MNVEHIHRRFTLDERLNKSNKMRWANTWIKANTQISKQKRRCSFLCAIPVCVQLAYSRHWVLCKCLFHRLLTSNNFKFPNRSNQILHFIWEEAETWNIANINMWIHILYDDKFARFIENFHFDFDAFTLKSQIWYFQSITMACYIISFSAEKRNCCRFVWLNICASENFSIEIVNMQILEMKNVAFFVEK